MHCDLEALLYRKMFCLQLQTNDSSEMNSFQRRVPPVTLLWFAFPCKLLPRMRLNEGDAGAPQLLVDILSSYLRNQRNLYQHHITYIITWWHFQWKRIFFLFLKKRCSWLNVFRAVNPHLAFLHQLGAITEPRLTDLTRFQMFIHHSWLLLTASVVAWTLTGPHCRFPAVVSIKAD